MNNLDFYKWMIIKDKIDGCSSLRSFLEREIWWCSCGKNVGVEINGKGKTFSRPFLILKKISKYYFFGIPLTTKRHSTRWYKKFTFDNDTEYAALNQARVMSAKRLYRRIGRLSIPDFNAIHDQFLNLYS